MTDSSQKLGDTHAIRMIRERSITFTQIGKHAGLPQEAARRALDPRDFHRVGHGRVMRVRASVEKLLRTFGWTGKPAELWSEYDERLAGAKNEQHAA